MFVFVFQLNYHVEDFGGLATVAELNRERAYRKLAERYPNCPNIKYVGIITEEM